MDNFDHVAYVRTPYVVLWCELNVKTDYNNQCIVTCVIIEYNINFFNFKWSSIFVVPAPRGHGNDVNLLSR